MREEYAFTVQDVVAQMRALAAERPEYVYRAPEESLTCSYVTGRDGQGCVVGQALARLGVPAEVLRQEERRVPGGMAAETLLRRLLGNEVARSLDAAWVATVQRRQDDGIPWGDAVASADSSMRRYGAVLA